MIVKKITLTVYLLLTFILLTSAFKRSDVRRMLQEFGSACEPPPTDEDLDAILNHDPNPKQSAKCFRYCLLNQSGALYENGKLNLEVCTNLYAMLHKKDDELIGDMVTACNTRVHDVNLCDKAHSYAMCFMEEAKRKNLKVPELKD